jgi:pimeloyl-ACP methyl ester carboxylesterase
MTFYSGFSLSHDKRLFDPYLKTSEYTIAGFSYGAISAFEEALQSKKRVDTLQLFSPAFFQDKNEKFKRMQMIYFLKEKQAYLKNFLNSCFLPGEIDENVVIEQGSEAQLRELLYYEWKRDKLSALKDRGIEIEVYLGSEDRIIDPKITKAFFLPYATTYMINHAGHTLQAKENNEHD